ncbi:hypothetical protein AHF37_09699 [Paragonimus kellicotti]|nr:hypothetical protein AHF37_09699 [Paragonimus kellicotti]
MVPGVGPKFPKPIEQVEDLSRLNWSVDVLHELSYVYEAISLTRHRLNGKVPLIGFTGAPWTLMSYMIEGGGSTTHSKAKRWLYTEPEASRRLLRLLTETVITHLVQQTVAGAQLLQVFESHAGALTPSLFREFAFPCLKQIVQGVRERLLKDHHMNADELPPLIVFAKDGHYALRDLVDCGYDVLSLDWTITPSEARTVVGDEVALQGNLDPCALYSSDEDLRTRVRDMLHQFPRRRYVVNLGHGIYPDADPEKIFAQYIRRVTLRWFPEAHNVHISQRVGLMWRQMDRDIRDQYAKQAVQLQHLHSLEFPDYKYQPRKRARDGLNCPLNPVHNSPSGSSLTPEWLELGEDFPDGKLARFSLDAVPHLTTSESQQPWTLKSDDNQSCFTFASDQLNSCVHSVALLRPLVVSEYGSLVMQDSVDFGQQPLNTTTSLDMQSCPRSNTVLTSLMYDVEDKDPPLWCVSRQVHGSHTLEDLLNAPSFIPSDTIPSAISKPLHVFIQSTSSAPTTLGDTNYSSGSCLHGYQQDSLGFNDTETTYLALTLFIVSLE